MKPALLGFVFRRVLSSLRQLLSVHLLTAGTVAMTLYIFGVFVLVEINLQRLLKGWGDEIQVTAYLDKRSDQAAVEGLAQRVGAFPEVQGVRLTSQEQAWRDFQAALGSQSGLLDGLPRDVLPASLEISLKAGHRDGPAVEQFVARLRQEKQIVSVEYPQEWVERLELVVLGVEWAKWIFGGALFLTTFIIVGSTVKLAMLARRDEIEIMQLVGAAEEVIQSPFVLEGMLQGLTGASLSVALLGLT
ncbi:MAG TPA: ABC transporter permease, partial [Candidatus Binatia bacterium]|nr:ABC transporter permease [Candidatus Binatia bacterium]